MGDGKQGGLFRRRVPAAKAAVAWSLRALVREPNVAAPCFGVLPSRHVAKNASFCADRSLMPYECLTTPKFRRIGYQAMHQGVGN